MRGGLFGRSLFFLRQLASVRQIISVIQAIAFLPHLLDFRKMRIIDNILKTLYRRIKLLDIL